MLWRRLALLTMGGCEEELVHCIAGLFLVLHIVSGYPRGFVSRIRDWYKAVSIRRILRRTHNSLIDARWHAVNPP